MKVDEFGQQLQVLRSRVAALLNHTDESVSQQQLLKAAFEELSIALEEVKVAEEELRQQNEELESSRTALEVERQKAEAERQRYQDMFDFAPDAYLVTDAEGTIQEANRAAASLLNVSQNFLVGLPLTTFVTEEGRRVIHSELTQQRQGNWVREWEICLKPRKNVSFNAALKVAVVRNKEGKSVALRWLLRDISERKKVEAALQQINAHLERQAQDRTAQLQQAIEFEAMLKRITDKVRDSLDQSQILQTAVQELALVLGLSGCNAAWYNLSLGTSTICYEYVTSIPTSQGRSAQMAHFPEIYHQLLQGQYFQFCSIFPNPVRGHVAMLACPIMNDEGVLGDLWLINHKDYTFSDLEIRLVQQVANQCAIAVRQARLYQAATAQVEELEKLNRLKDDFLSTVSHELRTPVTSMKMAIRMLQTAPAPQQQERYLKVLQAECDREIELINNLLDLQQLEATSYSSSLEAVSLQDWFPGIIEPFHLRTEERQQILHVDLPPSLPDLICDRASLRRVLTELLNNAFKYTPCGGEIVFSVRHNSDWATLPPDLGQAQSTTNTSATIFTVSNSVEIPAAELPHIFEKFYRVPNADPWQQSGTGLGLALVQKLIEQMQGTINVKSARGWTTFTVQLPNQLRS